MNNNNNEIMYNPNQTFGFLFNKLSNIIVVALGIIMPLGYVYSNWIMTLIALGKNADAPIWYFVSISIATLVAFYWTVKMIVDDNVQYISAKSLKHAIRHTYRNLCIGILSWCFVVVLCDAATTIQNKWFCGVNTELGMIVSLIIMTFIIYFQIFVGSKLLPFRVVTNIQ